MAGGKQPSEGSNPANPTALRIRDNQRRSRARHKEYVEGLQRKLQDYERRGVEATLQMQQAARNVAVENSRLRTLLGYHGVNDDDIDKFLKTFPDQVTTEAAKTTINQLAAPPQPTLAMAPRMPLQPLSKPPSAGPSRAEYVVPQVSDTSTRDAVDAVVGIRRESRTSGIPQRALPVEPRQPLLQSRPQPPSLPVLPALVVRPTRREHSALDKLSVLATASAQQDNDNPRTQSRIDELRVPSPSTIGQSPSARATAARSSRLHSASPRLRDLSLKSPPEMASNPPSQTMSNVHDKANPGPAQATVGFDGQDDTQAPNASTFRPYDNDGNP
ncbi:Fc.00g047370.m01.CDS01 [Cosmosporella sp. VM-42]